MEKLNNVFKIDIYATLLLLLLTLPIVYYMSLHFSELGYFDNIYMFVIWNIFLYIFGYILEYNYLIFVKKIFINKKG